LDKIIVTGYKGLQLCYFFTAGKDEVKAWTIQVCYCSIQLILNQDNHCNFDVLSLSLFPVQKHTKAPQAAGRIHTDFEKGFIMAEVMKFDDFKQEGSESACKVNMIIVLL
jgi:obg-like ATPase 1